MAPTTTINAALSIDILRETALLTPISENKDTTAASLVPAPAMVIGIIATVIAIGIKIKK